MKEALKLALEALETSMYPQQKQLKAITAIKEALANHCEAVLGMVAQPEQSTTCGEPVLWAAKESKFMWGKSNESGHPYHIICKGKKVQSHQIPLYTTPPQRTWVGLTDEEIEMIVENKRAAHWEFVRQVEAKLKELNT